MLKNLTKPPVEAKKPFDYSAERDYYKNPVTEIRPYEWVDLDLHHWVPNYPTVFNRRRILDIGAGEVLQGLLISERYNPELYVGVELIPHRLIGARTRVNNTTTLQLICGDCYHLPLASQSFDIVIGNGVLHHLPDLPQVVAQVKRVLRPGGIYIGREPNFLNPLVKRRVLGQHSSKNEHAVYKGEVIKAFSKEGFDIKITYFWRRLPWLHTRWISSSIAIHATLKG